ncbi:MAG: hypothetical protein QNJ16_03905 [Rhodobacter sp.]|nr:hypothetical protein [Rhodobacter sp.]
MTNRNESVHERLNRELWRYRVFNRHTWLTALAAVGILALVLVATVRIPGEIAHRTGIMETAMPLLTEAGPRQVLTVRIGDERRLVDTRATILHPARGEEVCVRLTTDWLTGRRTAALADPSACGSD